MLENVYTDVATFRDVHMIYTYERWSIVNTFCKENIEKDRPGGECNLRSRKSTHGKPSMD
jgi:hypothetical protein